jgi:hypothetical protein
VERERETDMLKAVKRYVGKVTSNLQPEQLKTPRKRENTSKSNGGNPYL